MAGIHEDVEQLMTLMHRFKAVRVRLEGVGVEVELSPLAFEKHEQQTVEQPSSAQGVGEPPAAPPPTDEELLFYSSEPWEAPPAASPSPAPDGVSQGGGEA